MTYISNVLKSYGIDNEFRDYLSCVLLSAIILIICTLVHLIATKIIIKLLSKIINKNKYKWDDILLERKVFHRLVNLIPGIIIFIFAPAYNAAGGLVRRGAIIYILFAMVFEISSLLDAINDIYSLYPISKIRPIKGLLQVVKIIAYIIIGIIIIGTLMNQNPLLLLGGIGALTAVFSFVFKDSILGFIAGIQLTTNDMLRIGDWIEMSKYGADGEVVDITLNTVKVQNFDKTIVTIPAYSLVSDSFKNWRGMLDFGGRRIKRSIYIDVNSITFCTPEMLDKFKKITFLRDYIIEKEKEISDYNKNLSPEEKLLANGRHMTNIGTFRVYIQYFLENHPHINKNMSHVARQLPPTENGLPLEIYAFTDVTDFTVFETVQSDIFDHIFSIAGEFGLRIFQNPSGYDMRQISMRE